MNNKELNFRKLNVFIPEVKALVHVSALDFQNFYRIAVILMKFFLIMKIEKKNFI